MDPVTLSLVGLTPMLAVCTTLLSSLSIGIAYLAVLILTSVTAFCTRRFIPMGLRICLFVAGCSGLGLNR